jgi:hypothetical protein
MQAPGSDLLMWQLALISGAVTVYAPGIRQGRRPPAAQSAAG